ncbi:hypothetical protein KL942_000004 [Ogataea angusta]|uniref:Allantoate permease n=1 Tax=Pichia angusta TaxID=870730 RepID=A0ABQ7S4M8_PICAN|nr:hypothetical protein KL942_000004 [Ogataea angusta]KAG7851126.1 hypothetical protein KL941_000795 [Ogataea angusta]KAG7852940.1 hypothetical protein KL940_000641 [Ogataea angusta]
MFKKTSETEKGYDDSKGVSTHDIHVQSILSPQDDQEIKDQAFELLKDNIDEELDAEEDKSVRRKIDWRFLPLLTLIYGLNYVDKASLSWAVMMNFREDTKLKGNEYSWVSSIFYFGYLGAEYPANILVHKFSVPKILTGVCLSWGVLMLAHIGAKNYAGILVIRFLLGISETPVSAAMIKYVGCWWKKSEQPMRYLCFNSGQGGLYVLFSLVSYGLGHAGGNLSPWKYIYIVLAIVSFSLGGLVWFFLPALPQNAKFLNEHEKMVAAKRVSKNMTGIKTVVWKNYQILHALKDPKTYLLTLYMFFSMIPNGGLTNFNTIVLQSFDFDKYTTLLVNLPWSFFSAGQMWVWVIVGQKFKNLRIAGLIIPMCIAITGLSIVYATEGGGANKWGRVFAYWMINSCSATYPFAMTLTGQLISGHTKQSFTNALVLITFALGNIVGPFAFKASDAPRYTHALATIIGTFAACIAIGAVLGVYIFYENRRRNKLYGNPAEDEDLQLQGEIDGLKDKTDLENKYFRFVY